MVKTNCINGNIDKVKMLQYMQYSLFI